MGYSRRDDPRYTLRTANVEKIVAPWDRKAIRDLRESFGVSQALFASLIGTNVKTVQAWERGQPPSMIAARMLDIIRRHPELISRQIEDASRRYATARSARLKPGSG